VGGQEIRVLDYIEGIGQVLAYYIDELRRRKYERAICYLPHDGVASNAITGKRYEDHLRDAGFDVQPPVKNQGRGAAMMRVEAVRRIGPKLWFNEATTEAGRDALGYYHKRRDADRDDRARAGALMGFARCGRLWLNGHLLRRTQSRSGLRAQTELSEAGDSVAQLRESHRHKGATLARLCEAMAFGEP
jgi:hypothetical protein